ncbi:Cysteine rich repeat family protein [Aphelenchoides avenae]|nr:Cysteine rich repeat family protein [Aphelenchus avenae]
MGYAEERDPQKQLGSQCMNALQSLMKVADIGSNYKVDRVLYASCKPLIEGKCQMDAVSEANTLTCLMRHLDGPDMTDECEKRLVEVQYFMARDWALDPQLYDACHKEAVERYVVFDSSNTNFLLSLDARHPEKWHLQVDNRQNQVDPGPQVLACLYRSGYDEEKPLSQECAVHVRRVLRTRAVRVNLIPDIEENCREALSEYCSNNVQPAEEMNCLQEHFEKEKFRDRYPKCYKEVAQFTHMEAKDTKLNRLLTRACQPVITTYCNQFANEEIDHGDVMECLAAHKETREMTPKCRSYVQHFEASQTCVAADLISMRDYHFNYRFTQACQPDITEHCSSFGQDKGAIIRCLSNIMFEHRVLGENKDLRKECKKQLRVAYLQQAQVDFDDKAHMQDADPALMQKCERDLNRLNCLTQNKNFEDVLECLRVNSDTLEPDCKSMVFNHEKLEAIDNTFDDELQKSCKPDIAKFCPNQNDETVLDCLSNTKIVRLLRRDCQKVVKERMLEKAQDDRLNPTLIDACKEESKQYCPQEFEKLRAPKYEQQQLGGILVACLREKYANGQAHLGQQCKDEVTKTILEAEFDVSLDIQLYKSCKNVIARHCGNTVIQRGGSFANVLECLKADFYTNQIQDQDCARQLVRRTQESLVDIHLDPALHEACSVDVQRICRDTPPGQSRIIMCLMDALHVNRVQMSQSCRTKLVERQKLWNMAHDEFKMVLPETWSEVYEAITSHPQRNSILTWLGLALLFILLMGCCCGRISKRTHSELKNR